MAVLKARRLVPGDTIGLIAPASGAASDRTAAAVKYFESLGYRIRLGKHLTAERGYLSASDRDRVSDLHAMFRDPKVKMILFLRGGYGTIRLLDMIDYELIKQNPKIVVGYSDATSLICALHKRTGLRSLFYGPMGAVDVWSDFDTFAEENFWRTLTSNKPFGELPLGVNEDGEQEGMLLKRFNGSVTGKLIGGNLTVLSSILGTPYAPSFKGSLFFAEDIDEMPYRIDRYLAQLRLMGAFEACNGVLLGQFGGCEAPPERPSLTLPEVFEDYFGKLKKPVVTNLPSGHVHRQWTLPFGARYRVEAKQGKAKIFIEASVLE